MYNFFRFLNFFSLYVQYVYGSKSPYAHDRFPNVNKNQCQVYITVNYAIQQQCLLHYWPCLLHTTLKLGKTRTRATKRCSVIYGNRKHQASNENCLSVSASVDCSFMIQELLEDKFLHSHFYNYLALLCYPAEDIHPKTAIYNSWGSITVTTNGCQLINQN
jgi:hypothetical protein